MPEQEREFHLQSDSESGDDRMLSYDKYEAGDDSFSESSSEES